MPIGAFKAVAVFGNDPRHLGLRHAETVSAKYPSADFDFKTIHSSNDFDGGEQGPLVLAKLE